MKKIIFIFIAIILVVFVALSIFGAGGEYAAEKLFYHAMKVNSKIVINPDVAPPALLATVENGLKRLISRYPKANITKTAHIALAEFYIAHKNYDKVIPLINNIMQAYANDTAILSTAQFLKGTVYEKQNNWPKALEEFTALRDKYPHTQLGMQIPIYIAVYYDTKGEDSRAKSAYSEARSFYEKMEKEYSGKNLGSVASIMLVRTYLGSRDYEKAGDVLVYALDKYSSDMTFGQFLPLIETIFIKRLGKPEKAVELYKSILEKTRSKRLKKILQKTINALGAKSKSVSI